MPFASTRPAPKSARKRAGTVSRFFASSEYSAVPSKAIAGAHGKKSDRGGGVGGAPPPRSVERTVIPLPPTKQPQSHNFSHGHPPMATAAPETPVFIGDLAQSTGSRTNVQNRQDRVQTGGPQRLVHR